MSWPAILAARSRTGPPAGGSARNWPRAVFARVGLLSLFIALQAAGVLYFIGDVLVDAVVLGLDPHTVSEGIATLAMLMGVTLGSYEIWRTVVRTRRAETALQLASGAFADLLRTRFERWGLTAAEREVALLTLKGFDASEIARLRQAAGGTVRAQQARIYAKSGCGGRGQFVSLFLDELLEVPLQKQRALAAAETNAGHKQGSG